MVSLPFLEKNSRLYFPAATTLRGTFPRSSMIRAMWSAHHHIHHKGGQAGFQRYGMQTLLHTSSCGGLTHTQLPRSTPDWQIDIHSLGALWTLMRPFRLTDQITIIELVSQLEQHLCHLFCFSECVSFWCVCPSPCSSLASATSSVEELPGIFSRECKVPRNTAQQLYDVGYVVY